MAVDKDLIKGINLMIQGKEEGFNILYSKTYNYVYGRAKMIMKDEQDALDLTQETFIQAYKNIHTLQDVNNIYAWLGGIVYRHGMKIFRKKRDLLVNEDAEGIFDDIVSEDKDYRPEDSAELNATSNVIKDMIYDLPEAQRAAILAYYYDNMKIDDIAEAFDCSSNTIKSRLNYAKKYLKDKIEAHEKKYAYSLHSLSPAVIILAIRGLLSGEGYTMSATAAQSVYNLACAGCGFAPAAIAVGEAGAAALLSSGGATTTSTVAASAASATTASAATTAAATTTTTAATTTAAATTAAATTTAASTVAATTAAATTAAATTVIGSKLIIGVATVVAVGGVSVGAVTVASNGGFEELLNTFFVEEAIDDAKDEEQEDVLTSETETEVETEVETETEDEDLLSYASLVDEIATDDYLYETDRDIQVKAMLMADVVVKYMGQTPSSDFKDLSDSQKSYLNYVIMNNVCAYDYQYRIPLTTFDDDTTGYSVDDVEEYLGYFYEGAALVEPSHNGYKIEGEKVTFNAADGEEQDSVDTATLYKKDEYLILETKVYRYDWETEEQEYRYTAKILYRITDEGPYGLQVVHIQTKI